MAEQAALEIDHAGRANRNARPAFLENSSVSQRSLECHSLRGADVEQFKPLVEIINVELKTELAETGIRPAFFRRRHELLRHLEAKPIESPEHTRTLTHDSKRLFWRRLGRFELNELRH
jgi:hypothetical protein